MIATAAVRLFSGARFSSLPKFWDVESIGQALGINSDAAVIKLLVDCHSLDPSVRPSIAQALNSLDKVNTELAASTLIDWLSECHPTMAQRQTITDFGGFGSIQQAAGTHASSLPPASPSSSNTVSMLAIAIAKVPPTSVAAAVNNLVAADAGRDKELFTAISNVKGEKEEVAAAAILNQFFQRTLKVLQEAQLVTLIEAATKECREVFSQNVSELTLEDINAS
jgi:hypothetical protein